MEIKLKEVIVRDYKLVNNQSVQLSDKLTCIIGDNASGKTTLLEGVAGRYSKVVIDDFLTSNSYVFSIDVSELEFLKGNSKKELTATFHFDGVRWKPAQFILEGHENYLEEIMKHLDISINDYHGFQKKIHSLLLEVNNELKQLPDEVWDAEVYGRSVIHFDREAFDEEVKRYETLTKSSDILFKMKICHIWILSSIVTLTETYSTLVLWKKENSLISLIL